MNYDAVEIRDSNINAHLDIEKDIEKRKNGLFTFTLRVNNGNIVDYNIVEYVNARKYFDLKKVIITELSVARNPQLGGAGVAIQPDNGQRTNQGGNSTA
jgi:hypothetical protein